MSKLELGGLVIYQPIRLDELNLLQFAAKLYTQRFGGKFKKYVFLESSASTQKKSNGGYSDDIDIDRFRLTRQEILVYKPVVYSCCFGQKSKKKFQIMAQRGDFSV